MRVPADFEAVAELVSNERVCERALCRTDPEAHVAKIREFVFAGFDHVHVHQVGADQEAFFRFYEREVLPRARDSNKKRVRDADDDRARRGTAPARRRPSCST